MILQIITQGSYHFESESETAYTVLRLIIRNLVLRSYHIKHYVIKISDSLDDFFSKYFRQRYSKPLIIVYVWVLLLFIVSLVVEITSHCIFFNQRRSSTALTFIFIRPFRSIQIDVTKSIAVYF